MGPIRTTVNRVMLWVSYRIPTQIDGSLHVRGRLWHAWSWLRLLLVRGLPWCASCRRRVRPSQSAFGVPCYWQRDGYHIVHVGCWDFRRTEARRSGRVKVMLPRPDLELVEAIVGPVVEIEGP